MSYTGRPSGDIVGGKFKTRFSNLKPSQGVVFEACRSKKF